MAAKAIANSCSMRSFDASRRLILYNREFDVRRQVL
jgi:hypothetical protein